MKASLTRISFHIVCIFRRPSRWRFFAAGIAREFELWIDIAIPRDGLLRGGFAQPAVTSATVFVTAHLNNH